MAIIRNILLDLIFVAFTGAIGASLFTRILFNLRTKSQQRLWYVLTTTVVNCVFINASRYYGMIPKPILVLFFTAFFLKIFYKIKFMNCFLSTIIYFIILGVANAGTALIFKFSGIVVEYSKDNWIETMVAYIIINFIAFLMIFVFKSFKTFSKLPDKIRTRGYIINTVIIILAFLIIMTNFYYYNSYNAYIGVFPLVINVVLMASFFTLCVLNTNTFFQLENKSYELENQIFYNKTMEGLMSELKRFKHNYNNMLAVIGGYIKLKQWDGLGKYFGEIVESTNNFEQSSNISLLNIKSAGVFGIITNKIEYAKNNKIFVRTIVCDEIKEVDMRISELCEVLGVLLDNAIEEASACKNDRYVDIVIEKENGCVSFVIENPIKGKVDIKEIFREGYTTKGNGHGTGLYIVKKIIEKYDNIVLNSIVKNNNFVQELIIAEKTKSAVS